MSEDFVPTPVGKARITWYLAHGSARAVALLGHGSATGIESADLQALAAALPPRDISKLHATRNSHGRIGRSSALSWDR